MLLLGFNFISWNNKTLDLKAKWLVLKGGTLKVDGTTNLNSFSCLATTDPLSDTINIMMNSDSFILMKGNINLEIDGFDCHNSFMTSDLRKTLNATTYPVMKINFISLNRFPELKFLQESIKGWVNIELAGVTKKYEVNYKFSMDEQKTIHLIGDRSVNFSDFKLTPPKKLGGLIRTKDNLDVEFSLSLKSI